MNSLHRPGLLAALVFLSFAVPASAQYMFMDTNGNGVHDTGDRLNSNGSATCVDIYLNTFQNRDGSLATCDSEVGPPLDLGGYIVNLRAVDGTVVYSDFVNQQPSFSTNLGVVNSDGVQYSNSYYRPDFLGPGMLPGGLHKLCSLRIAGQTGTPHIDIAASVAGAPYLTSFVTTCPGNNFDNVYTLTMDWLDVDGLASAGATSTPSGISGRVTGDCPAADTPLLGVDVCARAVGTTSPVWFATTDANGEYAIPSLAPGDYDVWVVEPLGFALEPLVTHPVFCNDVSIVDFALECTPPAGNRQKFSWWRFQFDAALGYVGGTPSADCAAVGGRAFYCADSLCAYLDRIYTHFYGNTLNRIDVYGLDESHTCDEKLHYVSDQLLNTGANESRAHRAKRELMTMLLNVVSGRIRWSDIVSADGRTASQAITYFDQVIASPPTSACGCYSWGGGVLDGGYGCAEHFAQQINGGTTICAGVIPSSTLNIAYRQGPRDLHFRAVPSGRSVGWTFSFEMPMGGQARLALFDVMGRHVATLEDRLLTPGPQTVAWDGRGAGGGTLARGIYFAQLRTPVGTETVKVPVTVR